MNEIEQKKLKARERALAWYYANIERAKAVRAKWYRDNAEKVKAQNIAYRARNAEKLREYEKARSVTAERKAACAMWREKPDARRRVVERVKAWVEANPIRSRALSSQVQHRRRAQLNATKSESVDLFKFRAKADCFCGICGKELDKNRAEIDHVIPLSRGGGHVWGNLQLAHMTCNRSKGNKLQEIIYSV
jgi:5-methylcytosine-specific restriction endonuclease McrA